MKFLKPIYILWFHGIINTFFLSLVCPKAFFVLIFILVSLYFAGNLSKAECGDLERRNEEETTYGAYDGPSCLWRSVGGSVEKLLKEDGGSLTKCGITKLVTVRCGYDGPSWRFVVKIREVIPVPRFQDLKCFRTKTLDGPLCLWRSVILAVEGGEQSSRRNCISMGWRSPWRSVVTTTIRRVVRRPSRVLEDFQQTESLFN